MCQINLVVGDVFKAKPIGLVAVLEDIDEVVKWFTNHSRALGILRQAQAERHDSEHAAAIARGETLAPRRLLTLIFPCLTRWTSHYLACSRLVSLEKDFKSFAWSKEKELLVLAGKKKEAKARARKVVRLIQDTTFWDHVRLCVLISFLVPLWFTDHTQCMSCSGTPCHRRQHHSRR
jgi:hypothetical protein